MRAGFRPLYTARMTSSAELPDHHGLDAPPDLCDKHAVLMTVLLGVLLAFMLELAAVGHSVSFWKGFALNAFFILWVVLVSSGLLCWITRSHSRVLIERFALIAFLVSMALILAVSLLVVSYASWAELRDWLAYLEPLLFILRNLGIGFIATLLFVRYLVLRRKWQVQVLAESETRIEALQARIHPHFLFNTLNTISSLIHDRPDEAERATMDLADLLRSGLSERSRHSLGEELELVRGYLRIEQLRLGDRLTVDWQLADDLPLDVELPALLLQPLVENAVVHGIARLPAGGVLRIEGDRDRRGRVHFVVENPVPDDAEGQPGSGNRMALDNVRQRLDLAWDEGARLKTRREDGRYRVELVLPIAQP